MKSRRAIHRRDAEAQVRHGRRMRPCQATREMKARQPRSRAAAMRMRDEQTARELREWVSIAAFVVLTVVVLPRLMGLVYLGLASIWGLR